MPRRHVLIRSINWVRRVNTALGECYPGYSLPLVKWIHDYMRMFDNEVDVEITCSGEVCSITITELLNREGLNEDALIQLDKILNEVYRDGSAGC